MFHCILNIIVFATCCVYTKFAFNIITARFSALFFKTKIDCKHVFQAATKAELDVDNRDLQAEANAARDTASDILSEVQDLENTGLDNLRAALTVCIQIY